MKGLSKKLFLTKAQTTELADKATEMDRAFEGMMAELAERELENQARELRKLLMLAGMDLESELAEPEVMEIIKAVLKNFDPAEFGDEEGAMFVATSARF